MGELNRKPHFDVLRDKLGMMSPLKYTVPDILAAR